MNDLTTTNRRKLDLGGTACFESPFAISISLDGTTAGDEICHNIIGDYNRMDMFADETFDEAAGSCYLEEKPDFFELRRVLVPGAIVRIKACDAGYAEQEQMEADMIAAGFRILEKAVVYFDEGDGEWTMDNPYVLQKPE